MPTAANPPPGSPRSAEKRLPTGAQRRPPTGAMAAVTQVRTAPQRTLPWMLALAMIGIAAASAGVTWMLVRHQPAAVASELLAATHQPAPGDAPIAVAQHRPPLEQSQLGQPRDSQWESEVSARLLRLPPLESPRLAAVGAVDWRSAAPIRVQGVELRLHGIVRYPKQPGHHPLVLLVHGNHGTCRQAQGPDRCLVDAAAGCPDNEQRVDTPGGLVWAADVLAARGWIAEVIDASPVVCTAGQNAIAARTELVIEHLRRWQSWQQGASPLVPPDLAAAADLQQVALIGHSTGADASLLAAAKLAHPRSLGLDTVRVRAVLLVAPPDLTRGPVPAVELGVVLPTCDYDIYGLQGRQIVDRADVAQPGSRVAMWILGGGSHNAFNQSWRDETVDIGQQNCDPSYRLAGETQRAVLGRLAVDWLDAARTGAALPPWLVGQAQLPVAAPVDLRAVVLPAGRRTPESQKFLASDGAQLRDCREPGCGAGLARAQPTWTARSLQKGAYLQWNWPASEPSGATHAVVRVAGLEGAPRGQPQVFDAALLDERGHATPAGSVEVPPPLDHAAEVEGPGSRPVPLGALWVSLPPQWRGRLAGLRLTARGDKGLAVVVGEVTLAVLDAKR